MNHHAHRLKITEKTIKGAGDDLILIDYWCQLVPKKRDDINIRFSCICLDSHLPESVSFTVMVRGLDNPKKKDYGVSMLVSLLPI